MSRHDISYYKNTVFITDRNVCSALAAMGFGLF